MGHQLGIRSGFLQCIRQHGQAVQGQFAAREAPLIIGGSGQRDDGRRPVGSGQGDEAEGVASKVSEDVHLKDAFGMQIPQECGVEGGLLPGRGREWWEAAHVPSSPRHPSPLQ